MMNIYKIERLGQGERIIAEKIEYKLFSLNKFELGCSHDTTSSNNKKRKVVNDNSYHFKRSHYRSDNTYYYLLDFSYREYNNNMIYSNKHIDHFKEHGSLHPSRINNILIKQQNE